MEFSENECLHGENQINQLFTFKNHQTIHPGPHLYECPDGKTYVNNNGAPYKYKTSRNPHGIFKCPLCNRIFQWVPAFRGHMNMHERRSEIPSNLSADLFDEISEKLRGKKTENRMTTTMQKIQAYIEKIDGSNEKNDIKATNYQKCNDGTGIYVDENYEKENAVFYHQGFEGNDDVSTYEIVQTKFLEIEQKHSHQSNSTLDQLNARDEMLKQNTASATCDTILKNADFKFCMKQWIAGKGINYKILRTLNIDYLRPTNDNYIESIQQHVECFYEQPNGSLYTNKIYEDNTANYIQQIPQNILSQQQFIPQQPSNYTFQELNNFQNANALANITDHAYNANYAYYQQNSPQETFNQQFIPQLEGNPYYENNLQAVYANKTVDPLSNYWQPQISSPQETFNQQFIPQQEENQYYANNLQAVYANETVDPLSNYWQPQISSPQGTFSQQFIPQPEGNPYYENNLQAAYANETVDSLSNYWQPQISSPQETFNQQFIPQLEGNLYYENNLQNEDIIDSIPNNVQCLISNYENPENTYFWEQSNAIIDDDDDATATLDVNNQTFRNNYEEEFNTADAAFYQIIEELQQSFSLQSYEKKSDPKPSKKTTNRPDLSVQEPVRWKESQYRDIFDPELLEELDELLIFDKAI
ncbi:Zinc finger protein [Trichinella pseudospiralis]